MAGLAGGRRPRGSIRRRNGTLQVRVYAGVDPVTGKDSYLTESVPAGKDAEKQAEKVRTRLLHQVDEQRAARTSATLDHAITQWLAVAELEVSTRIGYDSYISRYIRPVFGKVPVRNIKVEALDQYYATLRRCRSRCNGRTQIDHKATGSHECSAAGCRPHLCRPLGASTVRQIHSIISAALSNAVRWGWIPNNPAQLARRPKQPQPEPNPPNAAEAASIVTKAFAMDADWGTLVWLTMVTGMRRGELLGLRWKYVDLDEGTLSVKRVYFARNGHKVEKDTKTHQERRPALDPATVDLLRTHRQRAEERLRALGLELTGDAFVFSPDPAHARPYHPDSVSHRYTRMTNRLGIKTHLHALRHYNATELIRNGVDIRTVAGRLGHGGGGTTTLRIYTAFVPESDRRASTVIAGRMPALPGQRPAEAVITSGASGESEAKQVPASPYQRIADELRRAIRAGGLQPGDKFPSVAQLAEVHGVSSSTVYRAVALLKTEGLL